MNQITAMEVEKMLSEGKDVTILDVRETYEVAQGKIPGAINIPLGSLNARINELDKNKEYICVCLSGSRSSYATMLLASMGFKVTNMLGGMMSWRGEIAI